MTATWRITDALGRVLGVVEASSERGALVLAARRRPFAPYPLTAALLAGEPDPETHPTKRPAALAKRAATMAKKATARREKEQAMTPSQQAYHQKVRKKRQETKVRNYWLAKSRAPTNP